MCDYSSVCCRSRGCREVLSVDSPEDVDSQKKEAYGICQKGCGLVLLHDDLIQGSHCCLSALRDQNGALRAKIAHLDQEVKKQKVRSDRRERYLLGQVCAMQKEAQQLHAQYTVHISDTTKQGAAYSEGGAVEHISMSVHKEKDSLGFNVTGETDCPKIPQIDQLAGNNASLLSENSSADQVNGKDLSKASHDEAVEAFRTAKDPIVVQVLRRNPIVKGNGNSQEVHLVDVCTQTDITFEHIMALAKLRPLTPPVPDICPFLLSDSCHSLHTMDHEFYEGSDYLSNVAPDGERTEEFEYEEVELCRLNSQEKLGLTLCYRTDDEDDVAIYVSEVGPNSIAAKDGRIREGDRIIQINGCDVQDREEAVAALSSEDFTSLVLLVARPEVQLDEVWLDDEHADLLEELKMEMLEEQQHTAELSKNVEEDDITSDIATCSSNNQDSGVGHTDTNTPRRGHSKMGILAQVHKKLSQCVQNKQDTNQVRSNPRPQCVQTLVSGAHLNSLCPGVPEENGEDEEDEEAECNRFQQLLELKCQIRNSGEYDLYYSRHSTIECSVSEQDGVGRELQLLNEELRSIELECQNIMQAHQLRKVRDQNPDRTPRHQEGGNPSRGKLANINEQPEKSDKDSSSAYNTAESCRSTPQAMDRSPDHTPLTMDRSPDHSLQRRVRITNQKNLSRTSASCNSRSAAGQAATSSPEQSNPSESDQPLPADDEGCGQDDPQGSPSPYLSPYHSSQYWHASIPAHARHYQSYMQLVQQRSAVEYTQSQLSLVAVEPKMEWKVKVRGDGTRYITKRPARDRILRERALKIREERGGMTTDDDAASELKMGRYWSKEERKQQLARAREQRRRREFMQRSRLECLREAPQSAAEARKEVSIIELSHRKMMKRRNKKILDNWLTIQELMTHGARAPDGAKVHNAFLSVTTV